MCRGLIELPSFVASFWRNDSTGSSLQTDLKARALCRLTARQRLLFSPLTGSTDSEVHVHLAVLKLSRTGMK